jgi:hypothetical protein
VRVESVAHAVARRTQSISKHCVHRNKIEFQQGKISLTHEVREKNWEKLEGAPVYRKSAEKHHTSRLASEGKQKLQATPRSSAVAKTEKYKSSGRMVSNVTPSLQVQLSPLP